MLFFQQIEKYKNNTPVLPLCSFYVLPSEMVALHAGMDAQKQLLSYLTGEETTSPGAVYLNKHQLTSGSPLPEIGFFFLDFGHYERLTIKECLVFWKRLYQSSLSVEAAAGLLHLNTKQKTRIKDLTYSEQKRVQCCLILFQNPAAIVLEEWDQNLDIESKKIILALLMKWKKENKVLLMLTSNMETALTASDLVFRITETTVNTVNMEDSADGESAAEGNAFVFTKIPAKVNDKMILFDPPEIDYIESQDGKVLLFINNESFPCGFTLNELESKLQTYGFFRCHRSYIVNLQKVREVITWTMQESRLCRFPKIKWNS
ncbi:LytTR family transcriptional regulator DNA-binding domain-containing protein [Alkalicoccus halolimnae]|uniref:LytTR family transcriptional regulator DNA-binding domain-containing protein n=1 Tax=Alkalicoccus halolimnae TaxID=1667239 RepID=A0A5C7FBX0_9BACI|nr:LytTR family transcriptional regulator DNA-binding domain-containing protein [Alkalicoccus halolimnae]TXF86958.1 ABC transporter ATP-binding protein [Alkalicoccus halolimnae]